MRYKNPLDLFLYFIQLSRFIFDASRGVRAIKMHLQSGYTGTSPVPAGMQVSKIAEGSRGYGILSRAVEVVFVIRQRAFDGAGLAGLAKSMEANGQLNRVYVYHVLPSGHRRY